MKAKQLIILFVLAVVLVGLAVLSTRRERTAAAPPAAGRLVLPDLPVNDVARILIVNQGATVSVERIDGVWKVAEKHGYGANFDRVRTALIALADLKVGDQRQTTPQTRQELGLVEPDMAHPDATRIVLEGADRQVLARLLLGKHHVRKSAGDSPYGGNYPDGRYVSPDDGTTAYLVKQTLSDLTATAMSWIDSELLNIDGAELARIAVAGPEGAPVTLAATDGGPLTVTDITEQEEVDDSKLASLRSALSYLTLQDVADPARSDDELGFDTPVTFTAGTHDGRVFHLQLGGRAEGEARYLRGRVEFVAPPAPAADAATNAPPAPDHTATRLAAESLNRKLDGWTFIIPSYKAESMIVTREALVKPKAPAAPEADAPPVPEEPAPTPAAVPESVEPAVDAPPAPAVESPDADPTTPSNEDPS